MAEREPDHRDWQAIKAWTEGLATKLHVEHVAEATVA
jgi:hypothetical protein